LILLQHEVYYENTASDLTENSTIMARINSYIGLSNLDGQIKSLNILERALSTTEIQIYTIKDVIIHKECKFTINEFV
tara:strand:- start:655 stop:888 length:234 start_codon:yes stop_codon:yes gene_type:complete